MKGAVFVETGWKTWMGRDREIVRVRGELDLDSGPRLRDFLAREMARHDVSFIVDLSRVTFIDSSGLHALVASLRRAQLLNRPFSLVLDAGGRVQRLLEVTGLGPLFAVARTTAAPTVDAHPAVTDLRGARVPQPPAALAGS